jgi:signal transduction histidine kinase
MSLIIFTGLAAAHILSFWLVVLERGMTMRGMMVNYIASDVASSVLVLDRLPPAQRPAWLSGLERPNYSLSLRPQVNTQPSDSDLAQRLSIALQSTLVPARHIKIVERANSGELSILLALSDGSPLSVDLIRPGWQISPWVLLVLAAQLALLGGLCWYAVGQVTQPLRQLAQAADALEPTQLDRANSAVPVPQHGPIEVVRAASAFNTMRTRIQSHLDERMHMLAAISHDLQTPITRLRLRADLLDDVALRNKLLSDLSEMQKLVEQGISYARSAHAVNEPLMTVDLPALLESIASDYCDAGQVVSITEGEPLTWGMVQTRPQALKRLLCNLTDNALKFAGGAEITAWQDATGKWCVGVLDRGPGIAPEDLLAVMQPFYRVEDSRNRNTGGAGLGLAIAQQLTHALGGHLALSPREGGGLQAIFTCDTEART